MNNYHNYYNGAETNILDQKSLEVRALLRTASHLNQIKDNWDERKNELDEALEKNRRLWSIFAGAAIDGSSPQDVGVKNNIKLLAALIFKKTITLMINPEQNDIQELIDINLNIAEGLKTTPENNPEVDSSNIEVKNDETQISQVIPETNNESNDFDKIFNNL